MSTSVSRLFQRAMLVRRLFGIVTPYSGQFPSLGTHIGWFSTGMRRLVLFPEGRQRKTPSSEREEGAIPSTWTAPQKLLRSVAP
jgi:hypothetical protein